VERRDLALCPWVRLGRAWGAEDVRFRLGDVAFWQPRKKCYRMSGPARFHISFIAVVAVILLAVWIALVL
jgi:hypothetical protein